jgi:hypothetical protein
MELITSIILFIGSWAIYFISNGYSGQPGVFPKITGALMGTLAGIYLVQVLLKKVIPQNFEGYPAVRIIVFLAGLLLYFVALEILGFYTASFIFYLMITLGYSKTKEGFRKKDILTGVVTSIGFIGVLYFMFSILLKVQIPKGFFI